MLQNLRTIRHDRRFSQDDLARLTELSRSYISLIERGLQPRKPQHITVIAAALGVSEEALSMELSFAGR